MFFLYLIYRVSKIDDHLSRAPSLLLDQPLTNSDIYQIDSIFKNKKNFFREVQEFLADITENTHYEEMPTSTLINSEELCAKFNQQKKENSQIQ